MTEERNTSAAEADIPPHEMSITCQRIEIRRKELGLTRAALADTSGVSASTIWNLSKYAGRRASAKTLRGLADALDVDVAWLAGDSDIRRAVVGGIDLLSIGFNGKRDEVWRAIEAGLAAGGGAFRALTAAEEWPCFGIPAGATIIVDTSTRPQSGTLVAVTTGGAAPSIRYFAEPYLIGISATGEAFHETRQAPDAIMGTIIASISRH